MTVALFAPDRLPLPAIEATLRREGLNVSSFTLTTTLEHLETPPSTNQAALITNESGIVNIGEQTEHVRSILGEHATLILCAPPLAPVDREMLFECGASLIVVPQSWSAEHIGERVLGEILVSGQITPNECGPLRGSTFQMRELYADIERLAPLTESILILGETGTGKELVAKALHDRSGRAGTYVPINCPEIDPNLISSELFGHVKGAFSGADKTRVGLIASAGNGTIFLDEIGDLDLQSQAKLLRVLEDRTVRRVGANNFEPVGARIILATNRNLEAACEQGKFRNDLYERIHGFTLHLTPLRERKPDIPILAHHFVNEYNDGYKTRNQIPTEAMDCLFQYDWPGNVRELRSVIRRATAYADPSGHISSLVLQESRRRSPIDASQPSVLFDPAVDTWRDLQRRMQTTYFRALLTHTNGNRESAIRLSGLSKSQFFEKLKELSKES